MKQFVGSSLLLCALLSLASADFECYTQAAKVPQDWLDMTQHCKDEVRRQIQVEIDAAVQYMAMGAHFAQESVNRPGFSEFFFKASGEEREHAGKLISYLLMRGELASNVTGLITINTPSTLSWSSSVDALKDALRTEAKVTKSIRKVIEACENDNSNNDYHLVDFLTGEFLDEQYHGQRDLAGKIATLDKLMKTHGPLGEFLQDKKLME